MKQTIIFLLAVWVFSAAAISQNSVSYSAAGQPEIRVFTDSRVTDSATLQIQTDSVQATDTFQELSHSDNNEWAEDVLLPIVVVSIVFGTVIFIVYFSHTMRYKDRKAQYELVAKALEMGKEIPEGFLERNDGKNMLTQGIMSAAVGLGLFFLIMGLTKDVGLACIGILVMLYGIGKIAGYYLIGNSRNKRENSAEE